MSPRVPIRHPGPPAAAPFLAVAVQHEVRHVRLTGGQSLMAAVAGAMEGSDLDGAAIDLAGLAMGPYRFVMPDRSHDGVHAAWYSPTHSGTGATIRAGTAMVGRRDGAWWLHAHAVWDEAGQGMRAGHLLPDEVILPEAVAVTLHGYRGGRFEVALDEQTQFSVFHPRGGTAGGNALIAKVSPHHDITGALRAMIAGQGFARGRILGVGSLIGARFLDGAPEMVSSISEVFLTPGAGFAGDRLDLPIFCVDPANGQFEGPLAPDTSPVCVTFELLVAADP